MGAATAPKGAHNRDLGSIPNLGLPVNSHLEGTLIVGEKNFGHPASPSPPTPDGNRTDPPPARRLDR